MRFATCHPDRKHHARGLCHNCYNNQWSRRYGYMYQRVWQGKNPEQSRESQRLASKRYRTKNKGKLKRKRFLKYWKLKKQGVNWRLR